MDIAKTKRRENIAEYILYLWQLEDLLRALQFSPEAIHSQLIAPRDLDAATAGQTLVWYMDIVQLMGKEGKTEKGHLEHTMHLIADLDNFHRQLLELPAGEKYRSLYAALAPELPGLREKLDGAEVTDIELCFRALYAVVLYRLQDAEKHKELTDSVVSSVSPLIAELAAMYRKVENGEINLYEDN